MVNKKLLFGVAVGAVAALLVLWLGVLRNTPLGQHNVIGPAIVLIVLILGWPMKVYAILFLGENGSWPLPVLVLFLILTGLMWGIIVERAVYWRSGRAAS
jgi:hypothetical protein